MQSRRLSAIESGVNTFIGFFGSLGLTWAWLAFSPLGPAADATAITLLCTVWSLLRGYFVRRWFVRLHEKLYAVDLAAAAKTRPPLGDRRRVRGSAPVIPIRRP